MKFIDYAKQVQKDYEAPIVLAKVGNKQYELNDTCDYKLEDIHFITVEEKAGIETYKRSVAFMMLKAFYSTVPVEDISILFTLSHSLYVEVKGNFKLTQDLLDKVKSKMHEFVEKDIVFSKRTMHTDEAIELFKKRKMTAKSDLFKFRRVSSTTIYSLDGFYNYFYGDLAYSTGVLKYFDLKLYKNGFVLLFPTQQDFKTVNPLAATDNMYNTLKESVEWSKKLGVRSISDLNKAIVEKRMNDVILIQESLMAQKISDIARDIVAKNKKIVLVAGPSSSGKTSFSKKLAIYLKTMGLIAHPIACDNYFKERSETPVDEKGEYNFEDLDALDLELFDAQMNDLLEGKEVLLPTFNFTTGCKEYLGNTLQLKDNDVVIVEGIHCLNERFLPDLDVYRVYISALTTLSIDKHNRISTSDLRLLRRISRDAQHRNSDAQRTIKMWKKVRAGEQKNIFPYQENADVIFNSSFIYEIPVLKNSVEALLFAVDRNSEEYFEAKRLLKFLDFFLGYNDKVIPNDSIVREFVGGSCLDVG